jgi:8-oxo-dGTP pyrophosphatase MutT (NUDIX family)
VPRPERWRPGAPPPWAGIDLQVDVDRVLRALRAASPPAPLRWPADPTDHSAVLVPVFEEAGEAWLVLTRRAQHLRLHRGEVAFPGGRRDPGEALVDTAKREALEEIGLDPAGVEIVGELDHVTARTSQLEIVPFLGILSGRPIDLRPNADEVEAILVLPMSELLQEGTFREELWDTPEGERDIVFFEVVGDTIWGATARILHRLLELVVAV